MRSAGLIVLLLLMGSWANHSLKEPPTYTKADLIGDINPSTHSDFEKIRSKYTSKSNAYLREEVYDAYKDMWKAARKDGINLLIISATRNRSYQSGIWNRKWTSFGGDENTRAERILQYSSMPGTSRHHWGTDFDLNSLKNVFFESGEGLKIYQWLRSHAAEYGFYQPYIAYNNYRGEGYKEEKWHWSYFALASKFQRAYNHLITYGDLQGFNGEKYAEKLQVIDVYVNGVDSPPRL
jgi:D-alanyl-D-alanine carboxypeptidase